MTSRVFVLRLTTAKSRDASCASVGEENCPRRAQDLGFTGSYFQMFGNRFGFHADNRAAEFEEIRRDSHAVSRSLARSLVDRHFHPIPCISLARMTAGFCRDVTIVALHGQRLV